LRPKPPHRKSESTPKSARFPTPLQDAPEKPRVKWTTPNSNRFEKEFGLSAAIAGIVYYLVIR
jgi:hypothetical protein